MYAEIEFYGYVFGVSYGDGIIVNPKTSDLDNPLYITALKMAQSHYIKYETFWGIHYEFPGDILPKPATLTPHTKTQIRRGYVYLIRAVEPQNHYKIGRSVNAESRIEKLEVKLPYPIETICIIKTWDMIGLEESLHYLFRDKRVNGEWFALDNDDIEYIKGLAT